MSLIERLKLESELKSTVSIGNTGKNFSGNFYVKFGYFSSKNHVKLVNFVNFSGKYNKKSGIVIIFRARIM